MPESSRRPDADKPGTRVLTAAIAIALTTASTATGCGSTSGGTGGSQGLGALLPGTWHCTVTRTDLGGPLTGDVTITSDTWRFHPTGALAGEPDRSGTYTLTGGTLRVITPPDGDVTFTGLPAGAGTATIVAHSQVAADESVTADFAKRAVTLHIPGNPDQPTADVSCTK
jgi:hypothetical protein